VAESLGCFAALLTDLDRHVDAEQLYRRALVIEEASFGPNHSKVAIRLHQLAHLLSLTNRLSEAESLIRRGLAITFQLNSSGDGDPLDQREFVASYKWLLQQMGRTPHEVQEQLNAIARPYGIQFGSGSES
jgi:hypothetical protein